MSTPLLKTKLYVPAVRPSSFADGSRSALRARLVARPRLIERLDKGFRQGCKLTLISAPAGYGKTTLLGEWIDGSELRSRVAWVSLDKDDNDPVRFWSYVFAALQTVEADLGEIVLPAFQSSHPPPIEPALTGLLNQIAELPDPIVLVLDDYHVIQGDATASQAIHEGLAFVLDNMPPQMHLVLATRADPPLPIPRLRGRGLLTGLYQSDLRFSSQEITEFLDLVLDVKLSSTDLMALEGRTEGWIAGLQMAALSMRGREDVSEFVRAFAGSHRFILDYLGEEVLRQQPGDVQAFLMQTAILDRLSGDLCDAVVGAGLGEAAGTGRGAGKPPADRSPADSQSMLEYLERCNLFVVPLDEERHWYRYHHLFADLLRQRLQREHRNLVPELHRRASKWYVDAGWIPEAVTHSLAAADFPQAAELIERTAWATLTTGRVSTLQSWLDALPDTLTCSRSQLVSLQAWALAFSGRLDDVDAYLSSVCAPCGQGELAAVRGYIAHHHGETDQAIAYCQTALESLPEEQWFSRGIAAVILGLVPLRMGDPKTASQALAKAAQVGRAAHQVYLSMIATAMLGEAQEMLGMLGQAVQTCQAAIQLASDRSTAPVPFAGLAYVGLAGILYERNELEGAKRCVAKGLELSKQAQSVDTVQDSYYNLALLHHAWGNFDEARAALQEVETLAQRGEHHNWMTVVCATRSQWWLERGDVMAAFRCAQKGGSHARQDGGGFVREYAEIAAARVLVARSLSRRAGSVDGAGQALRSLEGLLQSAEAATRVGSTIKILVLKALALQALGNQAQALTALERALALAEREGYVRTFVDEGKPLVGLLRRALARGVAPDYVTRLLAALGEKGQSDLPGTESLVEPLSDREREVLRLIAAGLSNPEIAQMLVIAVSTVKSHVHHIYGKLGVGSRTRAVARARELGVL